MSDFIKHECGIAMIRLLKPLNYYVEKYGTALYGINKLHLLMEKQRNRGQDGAGIATVKLNSRPGTKIIHRKRCSGNNSIQTIFEEVYDNFNHLKKSQLKDAVWLKENTPFTGELMLGHLRYGTHGANSVKNVHPFIRKSNWIQRTLVIAGNFNLTNVDELFQELVELGQYPMEQTDTVTVLEKIGHFLDDEVQRLYTWHKPDGLSDLEINELIFDNLDVQRLLQRATKRFDGGYTMAGMTGHGDAFVMRDPHGIRPAFYYQDDEVVVVTSERAPIQTAFDVHFSKIQEIKPGHALIIKRNGIVSELPFADPVERKSCSFERIYFSRGNDRDIYTERQQLGDQLTTAVLEAVDYDIERTVFSFVPNTAESAFFGLVKGIEKRLNEIKLQKIKDLGENPSTEALQKILALTPRVEKLVHKDAKLRTFIADDASRGEMVTHGYDVTYGLVRNEEDTLVLLDDSIVRGTTLKESIIRIVARLRPKKIIIVSSAPQIRYPDCYGIDMSKMKDFVAFRALVELLKDTNQSHLLNETYERCKAQLNLPKEEMKNEVQALYAHFTTDEISQKIAEIVTPKGITPAVEVIYQSLEGLHNACPDHLGDWYFSGNYPTPGGNKVVNRAFVNYMEGKDERAY
ncbi:MAG: class II glutamine amidotransferase [Saprospiraceae bacterium]|nr:class II glutamine amidotransferase [Saprospiraceae bacterium]